MGLTMFEIYDNFLERDYFDNLVGQINDSAFTWKYCDVVAKKSDVTGISQEQSEEQFYFVHNIYEKDQPFSELYEYTKHLYGKLNVRSLIRSRVIMYMNQGKQLPMKSILTLIMIILQYYYISIQIMDLLNLVMVVNVKVLRID